jgi:hypothetical protein
MTTLSECHFVVVGSDSSTEISQMVISLICRVLVLATVGTAQTFDLDDLVKKTYASFDRYGLCVRYVFPPDSGREVMIDH